VQESGISSGPSCEPVEHSRAGAVANLPLNFGWGAENFIRFDCVRESHNVGDYGCATLLLSGAVGLAVDLKQRMPRSDIS
jgi:hypothetical protein